jgi:hypothetical protein
MTDKQALKKARERWGPNAGIDKYGTPGHWWHRVGVMFAGTCLMSKGHGKSWEEAFDMAEGKK